ncbi:hypothetical protein SynMEDNS5_00527 [Synechococcus sp. MEDNS5]|uniref:hypothetical protein n=1 Tax=Synechococcus sp. MEDNS5 TaxID=1442554 RepID=UPI0016454519|nr:hypothetical protein [Synechococcus sp. MEDNS5]QNJ05271.1 hypothetical protein SynMEDNS5_00527 [Synechococcus sp. MEDNS5]
MTSGDASLATVQQLSRQLHAVSEIAESLTLRLLSLEQRIQQLEVEADHPTANDEESQQLLTQSSDRLRHLHGLLTEEPSAPDLRLVEASEEPVDETVYVDDPQLDHAEIDPVVEENIEDSAVDQEQIDLLSA